MDHSCQSREISEHPWQSEEREGQSLKYINLNSNSNKILLIIDNNWQSDERDGQSLNESI